MDAVKNQRFSQNAADSAAGGGRSLSGKKVSRKWTEEEVGELVQAIAKATSNGNDLLNWAEIAKSVHGRTGKQCREKYKNDLRPDISKEPWVSREEFIMARAHSDVGNQWAEIAKYLPGRSENSIKNHWNATLRSKAEARMRTFLGVYGRVVLDLQGMTSREAFRRAIDVYNESDPPEELVHFQVPEEYFTHRPVSGRAQHTVAASKPRTTGRSVARKRSRSCDSSNDEDDLSSDELDEAPPPPPIRAPKRQASLPAPAYDAAPERPAIRAPKRHQYIKQEPELEVLDLAQQQQPAFLEPLGMTQWPALGFPGSLTLSHPVQGLAHHAVQGCVAMTPMASAMGDAAATITFSDHHNKPNGWSSEEMALLKEMALETPQLLKGLGNSVPRSSKGMSKEFMMCCGMDPQDTPLEPTSIQDLLDLLHDVTADPGPVSSDDVTDIQDTVSLFHLAPEYDPHARPTESQESSMYTNCCNLYPTSGPAVNAFTGPSHSVTDFSHHHGVTGTAKLFGGMQGAGMDPRSYAMPVGNMYRQGMSPAPATAFDNDALDLGHMGVQGGVQGWVPSGADWSNWGQQATYSIPPFDGGFYAQH